MRNTHRGRVCAVRRAEGIVDVPVPECGERRREGGAVRFLLRVESQVLEQHDLGGSQRADG